MSFVPAFGTYQPDKVHVDRRWCARVDIADELTDIMDDLEADTADGIYTRLLELKKDLVKTRHAEAERLR
ncbi:MAG TPA: hypothetical protein VGN72_06645 [Tepidisphaeraceae bacterium]|jgi:hypothetical protein|nr:hypothetical protein [Tepidisphaeraceae bacterium]